MPDSNSHQSGGELLAEVERLRARVAELEAAGDSEQPASGLVAREDGEADERSRLQRQLRDTESRFRQFFERAQVGLFRTALDGQVVISNPAILAMMGYESVEAMNEVGLASMYVDVRDRARLLDLLREGPVTNFGTQMRRADGEVLDINISAYLIVDDEGRPCYLEGSIADVTELKRLEARVHHAEKMDALGQLAGGIAHDFNNQLVAMMGSAEILLLKVEDESLRRFARQIIDSARRSADLTGQLLAYARRGQYRRVAVDLHQVIDQVITLLKHSIDKRIVLERRLASEPCCTLGDPTQLQSALLNLALNGRDAMPDGGTLTFATDVVDAPPSVRDSSSGVAGARRVRVVVRDTGVGMSAETARRVFEPFFTTKAQGDGTGMGLAAAYGTIRSHGGSISVQSEPGQGTRFEVLLPLCDECPEESPEPPETWSERVPAPQRNVLVVDDEKNVLSTLTLILRDAGYQVTGFRDVEEALSHYRSAWQQIDVVVLDMMMPKMGGREAFHVLQNINPDVKVLLSSGYSLEGEARRILDEGVRGFLQKPFRAHALVTQIEEAVRRR